MSSTAFNTHKVAKTLAKAGFTETQVEAQVEVLTEFSGELVSKKDIELLEHRLINTLTVRMGVIGGLIVGMVKYLP